MVKTIEKNKPPKKDTTVITEVMKRTDPMYAVFGDYRKHLEEKNLTTIIK